MQIVIDGKDFKRLSSVAQAEILGLVSDLGSTAKKQAKAAPKAAATSQLEAKKEAVQTETEGLRWREPVDLDLDQCRRLTAGMTKKQLDILKAFSSKSGRASMKKLLEVTGEKDLHGISKFQGLATRHLRHIIKDPHYKAQLFAWDFDKTKWDKGKTMIVDGEYYVSPTTAESLRKFFSNAA